MQKAILLLTIGLIFLFSACSTEQRGTETTEPTAQPSTTASTVSQETSKPTSAPAQPQETAAQVNTEATGQEQTTVEEQPQTEEQRQEEHNLSLQMMIGDTPVSVIWEDNEAVEALKELCRNAPLTISMSMYGGFEQVGSLGAALPRNDTQTTTSAGDIVLYSGDQIVVFYGSNSWAYTRLGHITDKTQQELTQLLSNGDITITLTY